MSAPDGSGATGPSDKPTMAGISIPTQQIAIQKSGTTFPIDLASAKISHVKSIDGIKVTPMMQGASQQTTFRTLSGVPVPASSVRVMMPSGSLMPQSMIKQLEGASGGLRTQIAQIPGRTLSNTSITVTRPVAPTAYIPRTATVATNIQAQRLSTPIRAQTPPIVAGNFIRSATVTRNSSSAATSVITPVTTTWMGGTAGQVQLLRTINHPQKQRIVTQNITSAANCGNAAVVAIGQPTSISTAQAQIQQATQQAGTQATIQTGNSQQGQQTFVGSIAAVLPQQRQTATLVYSSVASTQSQYIPTAGTHRFAVASALPNNQRQIRPIQLAKTFSATKLGVGGMNATSISLRAPNIPVLAPTISSGNQTVQRSVAGNVNIQANSLSTARIIQVQQQPGQQIITGTGAPQIIGSAGRIANGVMLQPIIMNTPGGGKIGIRQPGTVTTKVQQPALTITQLGLSKLPQASTAVSLQGATITSSNSNLNAQSGITQIVNVTPSATGAPILAAQNVSSSATVVSINTRTTNVLTGTITSIKASSNAPNLGKVLTQTVSHSSSGPTEIVSSTPQQQQANVFIHTRPVSSSSTTTVIPSSSASNFLPSGAFFYESVPASAVSSGVLSLTTSSSTSASSTSSNAAPSLPYNPVIVQSNNRTVGQIQIPSSTIASVGTTQTVAQLRYTPQLASDQTISAGTPQIIQSNHQIITVPAPQAHMIMPIKLPNISTTITTSSAFPTVSRAIPTPSSTVAISSSTSAFLRKRDASSPIRAAKNLAPTLLSMGNATLQLQPSTSAPPAGPPSVVQVESKKHDRPVSPHSRPPSSDGSTTVSVNSSPDIDQQMSENIPHMNRESHFNPINEMYANHQNQVPPGAGHTNGLGDGPPHKKSRRSTNDSQQSVQNVSVPASMPLSFYDSPKSATLPHSNKENAKPTEFVLRKPSSCTLLNTYKQNWKPANNHFLRYSDVKPREDRRPTVIDLANQSYVTQKINGWKIHHLSAQMEDLCEIETQVFDKLSGMLKLLEGDEPNSEIERINELVKGNIQRSKIIVEGVSEARNQIMKIFDHKSHVSDIIHRCASKRNFKKREKT